MQRPDINAIGAKWIAAFRLQGLRIAFGYVRNLVHPVTGAPVYALMSELNGDEGSYKIEVQDPETWPENASRPPNQKTIENAFRHEALHVRVRDFAKSNPSEADIVAEERAVWAISDAFDLIADGAVPHVAAMVAPIIAQGPKHFQKAAAMVRAMAVNPAATRRQTKGRSMAMDPETAKMLLDALDSNADPSAAVAAVRKVVESALTGGQEAPPSVQDPNAPPMGADAGNDPQNGKQMPDQNMMRAMKAELANIRSMKAELVQCLDIARPNAKTELVRAMRSDGFDVKPHQEKLVLEAKTIEEAQTLVRGMRATLPAATPRNPALPPNGNGAGLTRAQLATYNKMLNAGNPGAEKYRAECIELNEAQKGGK